VAEEVISEVDDDVPMLVATSGPLLAEYVFISGLLNKTHTKEKYNLSCI